MDFKSIPRIARHPQTPEWFRDTILSYREQSLELDALFELCVDGIARMPNWHHIADLIATSHEDHNINDGRDRRGEATHAKRLAELANDEINNGFPFLCGHVAIATWSAIEVFVEDLAAAFLIHRPEIREASAIQDLKLVYGEYEPLSMEEKAAYLVDLLKLKLPRCNNIGIHRFQKLLESFGLKMDVDAEVTRNLIELQHVRNVIVHRRGMVDRRLVDTCPWLNKTVGEKIKLTPKEVFRYGEAASHYVGTVILQSATLLHINVADAETESLPEE